MFGEKKIFEVLEANTRAADEFDVNKFASMLDFTSIEKQNKREIKWVDSHVAKVASNSRETCYYDKDDNLIKREDVSMNKDAPYCKTILGITYYVRSKYHGMVKEISKLRDGTAVKFIIGKDDDVGFTKFSSSNIKVYVIYKNDTVFELEACFLSHNNVKITQIYRFHDDRWVMESVLGMVGKHGKVGNSKGEIKKAYFLYCFEEKYWKDGSVKESKKYIRWA